MRAIEKNKEVRGSLKWIRRAVNEHTSLLNERIKVALGLRSEGLIDWKSPRADDDYAEYGDDAFLQLLGIKLTRYPLKDFWPYRGPQWDALATLNGTGVLLVEAKANIPEEVSPATGASRTSRAKIDRSLEEVKRYLQVDSRIPWSGKLYQYANRIAHLYLLRKMNGINAYLVFVYFTGDADVGGPSTNAEWQAALTVVKGVLGLRDRHRLSPYIADIFIDVAEIGSIL